MDELVRGQEQADSILVQIQPISASAAALFWKELEPVVRLELRVEASSSSSSSSSSSWFVELFVLHFVSSLV